MIRKRERGRAQCSVPDHCPMPPELRQPEDAIGEAIRERRIRRMESETEKLIKWR